LSSNIKAKTLDHLRAAAALFLWDAGAVRINLKEPFRLASGNFSPIYVNCRRVISSPTFMSLYTTMVRLMQETEGFTMDMVAGGETAGIPYAAYLGSALSLPMLYVRKTKKGYGLAKLVEGSVRSGAKVLLVEDLITDAGSKLHFIKVLRAAGCTVTDVLVLFDRGQGGCEALAKEGVTLRSVVDMDRALAVADEYELVECDDLESVRLYLADPDDWHRRMELEYHME